MKTQPTQWISQEKLKSQQETVQVWVQLPSVVYGVPWSFSVHSQAQQETVQVWVQLPSVAYGVPWSFSVHSQAQQQGWFNF